MEITISTGCLYKYPLEDFFHVAQQADFDGVELLISSNNCNIPLDYIRALSKEFHMPILSLHSPFVLCKGWGGFWEKIERSFNMAVELSIPLVNFHPPTGLFPRHRLTYELAQNLKQYSRMSEKSDIIITIENLPTVTKLRKFYVNRLFPRLSNNMYQILDFAENNNINITFDTTHVGTTGINLIDAYLFFKNRISNIHISDYADGIQHMLPGKGKLPLKTFLSRISNDGYKGLLTLETSPDSMEHENKEQAIQNAAESLDFIRKALKNHT
ncbi:TIM barrel protein [Candidatus Poribacteria bacterium]|nr:TIM barrel protein [Candidatus Poribacteria bacterium]